MRSWYVWYSKKLTMITMTIGRTKNPPRITVSGATCRYGLRRERIGPISLRAEAPHRTTYRNRPRQYGGAISRAQHSRGDELVPFPHHIAVLIHHRVPARH